MNYLDNFYGILFSPIKTLENLKENKNVVQALISVILISLVFNMLDASFDFYDAKSFIIFTFKIVFSIIGAIISWFIFSIFFEAVAYIFNQSGKLKEILTLTGFSLLPWLLIAPFKMLNTAGIILGVLSIYLQFALWVWVSILLFISVMKTYRLTFSRTIILFLIPLIGFIMFSNWFVYFFSTISKILN